MFHTNRIIQKTTPNQSFVSSRVGLPGCNRSIVSRYWGVNNPPNTASTTRVVDAEPTFEVMSTNKGEMNYSDWVAFTQHLVPVRPSPGLGGKGDIIPVRQSSGLGGKGDIIPVRQFPGLGGERGHRPRSLSTVHRTIVLGPLSTVRHP
jgi:hypothetical protein